MSESHVDLLSPEPPKSLRQELTAVRSCLVGILSPRWRRPAKSGYLAIEATIRLGIRDWRLSMRPYALALIVMLGALPSSAEAQTMPPTIQFESVPNPLKLPADVHLGEVAGVA